MIYGFAFIILIFLAALFKMMQSGKEEEAVTQTTAGGKAAERAQATTGTEAAEGVHTIAEATARARAAEKNEAQKADTPRLETVTTKGMEQKENKEKKEQDREVNTRSRDAFLETLTKIGCQYEIEEEDERINFAFQGEHFIADASNQRCYVQLWDVFWGQVELYDIDEFSRLRKAINTANINCDVMTIYTINEAGNNVDVHCKKSLLFLPEIPNIEAYLHAELSSFFRAHHIVGNEMAKMREEEKEAAK